MVVLNSRDFRKYAAVVLLSLFLLPGTARAADIAPLPAAETPAVIGPEWSFRANAYVWGSSLEGTLGTLPPLPPVKVDISFGDIIQNLNGALMGTFEARYGRFFAFSDLIVSKVTFDENFARAGFAAAISVESVSVIGSTSVGYRLIDDANFKLDGLAGVRGFYMDNTITLRVPVAYIDYGKTEQWVDGIVGARARYDFTENWSATAIAIVGGLSSDYEWDLFGGVAYTFNDKYSAFAGYRALKVDYSDGNFIYDVLQQGPVVGMNVRF
jgi:hypothetical protein